MQEYDLLCELNKQYDLSFTKIEKFREGGNKTFLVYTDDKKYFLKCVGLPFFDTFKTSIEVNQYLWNKGLKVPEVIMNKDNYAFIKYESNILALYEFIEIVEIDVEIDAEKVGSLIGKMHKLMNSYQGKLIKRDKKFYLDRYLDILNKKQYPNVDEYIDYSEKLWNRIKDLPIGYTHGDMYCGNIVCNNDGELYVLDFDTSCLGFPIYDLALICNQTDYFKYKEDGLLKTIEIYKRLIPTYLEYYDLKDVKIEYLCDMIALYHFALQATIIEIYGIDCVDKAFFDSQLVWLKKWETQCKRYLNKD